MLIRRLTPADIAEYREVMLRAYAEEPSSFTSTVAEREPLPLDWWETRLSDDPGSAGLVFGAFVDSRLVGVAGLQFGARERTGHRVRLFALYVVLESRRQGVAGALMEAVLSHARDTPGTRVVQLSVHETNAAAITFYEGNGFSRYGTEPLAIRYGEKFVSLVHMSLSVRQDEVRHSEVSAIPSGERKLESQRLFLREFVSDDFEAVHAYATDLEVVRYMEWGPNSETETREFLERARAQVPADPRSSYELAVVEARTDELIGGIGLHLDGVQAMVGYCFSRSAWGKGLATEAASLLVGFGFESLGIHRVWARCDSENAASLRVLEKLGMRREGLFRHDCRIRSQWRDTALYAILEDEWRSRDP